MHTLCSQLYYGMTEEDLKNAKRKDSLFARSSPFAFFSRDLSTPLLFLNAPFDRLCRGKQIPAETSLDYYPGEEAYHAL